MDTTPIRIVVFWRFYDGYHYHLCQQEFVRDSAVSVALHHALKYSEQYEGYAGSLGFLVNPTPEAVDEVGNALHKSII